MPRKILTSGLMIVATLPGALSLSSCSGGNTNNSAYPDNSTVQSSPSPGKTGFEADLEYVRKGQYNYVLVFSRKDGQPLDKDDGAYLRTNAPQVVDWVTTEQGKKVIAGTNFDMEQGKLSLLQKRFVVEDYTNK